MSKRSISFDKEFRKELDELIYIMGLKGTYGAEPRALKFGVKIALRTLQDRAKFTYGLNTRETEYYFHSIKRVNSITELQKTVKNTVENGEKFTPEVVRTSPDFTLNNTKPK